MNEEQKKNALEQLKDQQSRFGKCESTTKAITSLSGGNSYEDAVNSFKKKADLEEFVKSEKGFDLDKRKKLADMKKDALELA